MCGLTALFGTDITRTDILGFQKLAQLSALRGQDSVGFYDYHLAPPRNEKHCRFYKELGSAGLYFGEGGRWDQNFYFNRYFTKKDVYNPPVVLVAHARAATKGAVSKANAHPFYVGDILGVHNGTIHSHFEDRDKFETDSEALFSYMAKHGEQKGLDMVNSLFHAAYALMWVNLKEKTFNIARNADRTLYYSRHRTKDICFLSSDRDFLVAVCSYVNKELEQPKIVPTEQWIVFELDRGNILKTEENVQIKNNPVIPVQSDGFFRGESSVYPLQSWRRDANSGQNNNSGKSNKTTWEASDVLMDDLTEEDVPSLVKIHEHAANHPYEIRPGIRVDFSDYQKILNCGCAGCRDKPFSYLPAYVFKDKKTFLCETCASDIDCVRITAEDVKFQMDKQKTQQEQKIEEVIHEVAIH